MIIIRTYGSPQWPVTPKDPDFDSRQAKYKSMNTTAACLALLPPPSTAWKRLRKYSTGNTHWMNIVRVFENRTTKELMTVVYSAADADAAEEGKPPLKVFHGDRFPQLPDSCSMAKLKAAAKQIKHCGDYGNLYVNPSTREVWWCASDGDCDGVLTSAEDIKRILKLPGIRKVTVEAEHSPELDEDDEDEDGSLALEWLEIPGPHGIEVPYE